MNDTSSKILGAFTVTDNNLLRERSTAFDYATLLARHVAPLLTKRDCFGIMMLVSKYVRDEALKVFPLRVRLAGSVDAMFKNFMGEYVKTGICNGRPEFRLKSAGDEADRALHVEFQCKPEEVCLFYDSDLEDSDSESESESDCASGRWVVGYEPDRTRRWIVSERCGDGKGIMLPTVSGTAGLSWLEWSLLNGEVEDHDQWQWGFAIEERIFCYDDAELLRDVRVRLVGSIDAMFVNLMGEYVQDGIWNGRPLFRLKSAGDEADRALQREFQCRPGEICLFYDLKDGGRWVVAREPDSVNLNRWIVSERCGKGKTRGMLLPTVTGRGRTAGLSWLEWSLVDYDTFQWDFEIQEDILCYAVGT